MLTRCLLFSSLVLVPPPRVFQGPGVPPEPNPGAPIATDPAAGRSDARPVCELATPLRTTEWMQQIEDAIARSESFWSNTSDGAFSAPNRSNGLRSRFGADGLQVFPRQTSESGADAPWKLSLRTRSFGVEGDIRPLGEPRLVTHENRIEAHYAALSEWYVNDERGIEQGWTIPAPPPGSADTSLRIEIEASGLHAEIVGDGRSTQFVDDAGERLLYYHGLRAWDATSRELVARLIPASAGFAVEVEVEGALYPITVDPVLDGPAWMAESDQVDTLYGTSVSGAGDVNGDGFDDVIVGAPRFDNGFLDRGRAFLFLGSAAGPSLAPNWTAEADQDNAWFGWSVSGAGDVNGDGFDDVIVGAPFDEDGQTDEGVAFVYLGSAGGLSLAPVWTADRDQAVAFFGRSVSGAGDVNGDGFDDVIVGAPQFHDGESWEGAAFVYLGSPAGPALNPSWTAESDQTGANFGTSVSGAGDLNGDGFDDVIVGAPHYDHGQSDEGRAFLYFGSAAGLSLAPDWREESDQANAFYGTSLSGAGDVNRDGFDDFLVGAPQFTHGESFEGSAFLYLGSVNGPAHDPAWTAESDHAFSDFGFSVSGAGDVNGDGFADVVVGAPWFNNGQPGEGAAFLYLGSAGVPSLVPAWTAEGEQDNAHFGVVSGAGDVNGDGAEDVIVGASQFDNDQVNEGRAYVYVGGCGPIGTKYCIATANSTGSPADISAACSASASAGKLMLDASPVPNQNGVFFHGANQIQAPFGNGFMCTSGSTTRGATISASGNRATYTYDNSDGKHRLGAFAGMTRNFQYWFRDPMGGGALFNTSNAISIAILP